MIAGFETANGEIYEVASGGQTRRIGIDGQKSEWAHCLYLKPEPNGSRPQTVTSIYDPSTQRAELRYASKKNDTFEPMVYENALPLNRPRDIAIGMITILDSSGEKQVDCKLAHGMPDYGSVPFELSQDKYGFNIPRLGQAIVRILTKPELKLELKLELTSEEALEHQKTSTDLLGEFVRERNERLAREAANGSQSNTKTQPQPQDSKVKETVLDEFLREPQKFRSPNATQVKQENPLDEFMRLRKKPDLTGPSDDSSTQSRKVHTPKQSCGMRI